MALAMAASVLHLVVHGPAVFARPLLAFDEGIPLSTGFFISDGLVPFRDFTMPYGPAFAGAAAVVRSLGFESLLAWRVVALLGSALLAGLFTFVIARRHGRGVGMFTLTMATVAMTGPSYLGTRLAFLAAVLILELRPSECGAGARPVQRAEVAAGTVLAVGVWFRFEFAIVLVLWMVTVVVGRGGKVRPAMAVPWAVGAAPYLVVVALGGFDGLRDTVVYAASGYGTYRRIVPDYDAWRAIGEIGVFGAENLIVTLSFVVAPALVLLLISGPILDRFGFSALRVWDRDPSRLGSLVVGYAAVSAYSLHVRGDALHGAALILPLWLAVLWNRLRVPKVGAVAAGAVAVTVWLVLTSSVIVDINRVRSREGTEPAVAGLDRIPVHPVLRADLADLRAAWTVLDDPERAFVANTTNDFTFANAVVAYWLLEAQPASRTVVFDPGHADQEAEHRRMAADLCAGPAPLVLGKRFGSLEHPDDLRFSDYLDRFIVANTHVVHDNSTFEIRAFDDGPCVLPAD